MEEENYCDITYVPQPSLQNHTNSDEDFIVNLYVNLTYVPTNEFESSDMGIDDYFDEDYEASLKTNLGILVRDSDGPLSISRLLSEAFIPEEYKESLIEEIMKKARDINNMIMIVKTGTMNVQIGLIVEVVEDDIEEEEEDMGMDLVMDEGNNGIIAHINGLISRGVMVRRDFPGMVQIGDVEEEEEEEDIDMDVSSNDYDIKLECVLNTEKGLECAICLSEIRVGTEVDRMPTCPHLFHGHCISAWFLRKKTSCPLCRAQVF